MDNWDLLGYRYQRIVDEFIEAVLDGMELGDMERNVMGVVLLLDADANTLERLPEWLDSVSTLMPAESDFLTEMSGKLYPIGSALLAENLALSPEGSEIRRAFDACLWEMAPFVSRGAGQ